MTIPHTEIESAARRLVDLSTTLMAEWQSQGQAREQALASLMFAMNEAQAVALVAMLPPLIAREAARISGERVIGLVGKLTNAAPQETKGTA